MHFRSRRVCRKYRLCSLTGATRAPQAPEYNTIANISVKSRRASKRLFPQFEQRPPRPEPPTVRLDDFPRDRMDLCPCAYPMIYHHAFRFARHSLFNRELLQIEMFRFVIALRK